MPQHLRREIENLKKKILALGAKVEESVREATLSIHDRDREKAVEVINNDYQTDQSEVDIEEDCLKILALHQPVAIDLRFIVAVLKTRSFSKSGKGYSRLPPVIRQTSISSRGSRTQVPLPAFRAINPS